MLILLLQITKLQQIEFLTIHILLTKNNFYLSRMASKKKLFIMLKN